MSTATETVDQPIIEKLRPITSHEDLVRTLGVLLEPLQCQGEVSRTGDGFDVEVDAPDGPDARFWVGVIDKRRHGYYYDGDHVPPAGGDEPPESELTSDEASILDAFHQSGLSAEKAIRRLRKRRVRVVRKGVRATLASSVGTDSTYHRVRTDVLIVSSEDWLRREESQQDAEWGSTLLDDGRVLAVRVWFKDEGDSGKPRHGSLQNVDPVDFRALKSLRNVLLNAFDADPDVTGIGMFDAGNGAATFRINHRLYPSDSDLTVELKPY